MNSQRDYKKLYKQSKTENIKLKQTIEIMTQAGKEQVQMIEELRRAVADLKRNLGQHDNYSDTPKFVHKKIRTKPKLCRSPHPLARHG